MSQKAFLRSVALAAFSLLTACNQQRADPIAADDYFPLAAGHQWSYRTVTQRGDSQEVGNYAVKNLGKIQRDLEVYWGRSNSHGTEYLFRQDDTGVFRVGVQTMISDTVKHDARKRYVLKKPHRKDDYWFADSHAFVIERTQPIRERFWNTHPFEMEYQIIGTDETVRVPAGEFKNCLRVQATGIVKLLADVTQGRYGSAEGEIITDEWYAPGVGLIKMVRQEHFDNSLFVDGSYRVELVTTTANAHF